MMGLSFDRNCRRLLSGERRSGGSVFQTTEAATEKLQIYGHSKLCNTADGRDLGFGPTGNSEIQSDDLENPTLESNTKWIG